MTGIDYRREWNLIVQEQKSLEAHARERLYGLIKLYPNAQIDLNTTAKELSEIWIENISALKLIGYIEKIEEWSALQQKVVQTKIKL
jgi:hypothetical protein